MLTPESYAARTGQRICTLRCRQGMSVDVLAALVGMSRDALWAIEQGTADPSLSVLALLADMLGVRLDALIMDDETLRHRDVLDRAVRGALANGYTPRQIAVTLAGLVAA